MNYLSYYPYCWYNRVRSWYHLRYPREGSISKIREHIFISDFAASFDKEHLKELGITHILTVISGVSPAYPDDFQYMNISLQDSKNEFIDGELFEQSHKWIKNAIDQKGNVLIHCSFGVSRSVTFAIAYLCHEYGMAPETALMSIQCKRPQANPIPNYIDSLDKHYTKEKRMNLIKKKDFVNEILFH